MRPGIVFDLDETLIDRKGSLTVYAQTLWSSLIPESKYDEQDFLQIFHEIDGNGRIPRPDFFAKLSQTAFFDVGPEQIAEHFRDFAWRKPRLFDGVLDVINAFKANSYAVGIVTNGGSHSQRSKIANSGLLPYIDAFVISEEFGRKKPDPAIYNEIAVSLDIEPADSWFIGDDPISDVAGPAACGFNVAWLERYLPWPADCDRCYTHRVQHISELSGALFGDD